MNFLRNLTAAILGFFIAIFLLLMLFAVLGSSIGSDQEIQVKNNSILTLDLSLPIKDYAPKDANPFATLLDLPIEKLALDQIIVALENAKTDDRIKGININTTSVGSGMAQSQTIRKAIEDFKSSGKFVYAYNDMYDQKNYYISSVADSIFLNPVGAIDFKGLTSEVLYYKDFEDKYGIKMEVIRHGKYKSAVEPFLSNEMSEANREQISSFLNSIWSVMTQDISASRGIPVADLNSIANNSQGRNAELSKTSKLIDGILYEDEYEERLKQAANISKIEPITIEEYIGAGKGRKASTAKNKIAVIYAQCAMIYGEGNEETIGQGIINKAIKKAVKDKQVKAIVLRVNSPGGSALASELIWRELELAKKEKPLVVSMGNLAASGGYYIACNADKIIAEPTTITGSIGVFGALPNAYEFTQNIGINAEHVRTNSSAYYSVFEPMNDTFYEVTKEGVEQIYNTFVSRVATGRNMSFDAVNAIAQGRVWTGKEALKNGLVDALGSLENAIETAAELAEISDYRIRKYPNYKTEFKDAFNSLSPFGLVDKEILIRETLGEEQYRLYQNLNQMKHLKGIQTRMPYILEIK